MSCYLSGLGSPYETRPCCSPDSELDLDLLVVLPRRFGGAASGDFEREDDLLLDLDLDADLNLPLLLLDWSSSIRGPRRDFKPSLTGGRLSFGLGL